MRIAANQVQKEEPADDGLEMDADELKKKSKKKKKRKRTERELKQTLQTSTMGNNRKFGPQIQTKCPKTSSRCLCAVQTTAAQSYRGQCVQKATKKS